jgi:hypothetical protein
VQKLCLFAPAATAKIWVGRGRKRGYLWFQCSAAGLRLPLYPPHESGSSMFLRSVGKSVPDFSPPWCGLWSLMGASSLIAFLTFSVSFDVTLSYCCKVGSSKVLIWFPVGQTMCPTVHCHVFGALNPSVPHSYIVMFMTAIVCRQIQSGGFG